MAAAGCDLGAAHCCPVPHNHHCGLHPAAVVCCILDKATKRLTVAVILPTTAIVVFCCFRLATAPFLPGSLAQPSTCNSESQQAALHCARLSYLPQSLWWPRRLHTVCLRCGPLAAGLHLEGRVWRLNWRLCVSKVVLRSVSASHRQYMMVPRNQCALDQNRQPSTTTASRSLPIC